MNPYTLYQMKRLMTDKTVADVISYKRDMEDKRFIQIYAGVGSGKNYFIERFFTGDEKYDIPKMTVLLITSRRAKVDEYQLTDEDAENLSKSIGKWGNMHKVLAEAMENGNPGEYEDHVRIISGIWGESRIYQTSAVCTNAFIEKYLQHQYNPQVPTSHLWNLFDMIVIDEVHSVIMDATYQSAPFYIHKLVNEILRRHKQADIDKESPRPQCKNIVLMTGSPEPIKRMSVPPNVSVKLDIVDQCRNVVPQNIRFIEMASVKKQIESQLNRGERILYFSNHTILPEEFCTDTSIDPAMVASSFSKPERRTTMNEEDLKKMEAVEQAIRETCLIPQDVRLLISTSRNKEGINIKDEDIQHIYVESHNRSDIIQMAGRVRCGAENLFVITDSIGFQSKSTAKEIDRRFSWDYMLAPNDNGKKTIDRVNQFLEQLCKECKLEDFYDNREANVTINSKGAEKVKAYVTYIHEKFPYIRYDYFRNVFSSYYLKLDGEEYQMDNEKLFQEAEDDHTKYQTMFQEWFPESLVHPFVSREDQQKQEALAYIENLIKTDSARIYTDDDVHVIIQDLNKIFDTTLSNINVLMKKFCDYKFKRAGKDPKKPRYKNLLLVPAE